MTFRNFHQNNLSSEITFFLLSYLSSLIDTDDTKGRGSSLEESLKPLQVGITNPTPSQQSGNVSPAIPSNTLADDEQRTSRPTSSSGQRDYSPKALPSPDTATTGSRVDATSLPSSKQNQSVQNLPTATPIAPAQSSYTTRDYEQGMP